MPIRVVKTLNRADPRPVVRRSEVTPGAVFALVKRDGSASRKHYVAIGSNGKYISVNTENGAFASTANGNKRVVVVGKANITTSELSHPGTETTRRAVRDGQVFQVAGKETMYLALGRAGDKYASLNMAKPLSGDYSSTPNGDSKVQVLGTWGMNVALV